MTRFAAALCLALLTACSTPPAADGGGDVPKSRGDSGSADEIRADLDEARRQLAIAELSAGQAVLVARAELESARRALQRATDELELWKLERFEIDEVRLDIARSESRLEESRAELAELEAMYEEEEFAKTTKELVLTRGRRQVELAEAALAVARARYQHKVRAFELERTEKESAVDEARIDVQKAEGAQKKAELETDLEVLEARRKVEEFEKRLAERESGS